MVVEGWRFIAHSYSCVNMWQLLELAIRPNIDLYHREMPLFDASWERVHGLFDPLRERRIDTMYAAQHDTPADIVYRIYAPFLLKADETARKTIIFATAEWGFLTPEFVSDAIRIDEAVTDDRLWFVTPSHWSKLGLMRSGVPEERIDIVPHGVDTTIFKPLPQGKRDQVRKELGWQDSFVFLNVGAMTSNKGILQLLTAFGRLVEKHPDALLCLKGMDSLYDSSQLVQQVLAVLDGRLFDLIQDRIRYIGASRSFHDMAAYYQAADAYVSPYMAEGFNLPALEAMACGLPVICTQGGPTDDFIVNEAALRVSSNIVCVSNREIIYLEPDVESLVSQMERAMDDASICCRAMEFGPRHASTYYTWRNVVDRMLTVMDI